MDGVSDENLMNIVILGCNWPTVLLPRCKMSMYRLLLKH